MGGRPTARAALLALVAAALLPGCSDGGGGSKDDAAFDGLGLSASATTGIIRGVVVDEAIRPVAGVAVVLQTELGPQTAETREDGLFGFDSLPAGTYFMEATKPGFITTQSSADVVPGEAEPPITKIRMVLDPLTTPYFTAFSWSGFIECSFRVRDSVANEQDPAIGGTGLGVNACSGQLNQDSEYETPSFDEMPDLVQGELVWESTQTFGSGLSFVVGPPSCDDIKWGRADGPSPLVIKLNATTLEGDLPGDDDFEPADGMCYRVFSWVADETSGSVGIVTSQRYEAYFHAFYNFEPAVDWQFSLHGPPVIPQ